MLLTTEQTTFASGELDPTLRGQSDLKAYAQGVKRLRDCSRRATGGVERRPGSYDLIGLPGLARLAEFEYSDSQRYVIAFTAGEVRIFSLNGELLQVVGGCPWTTESAFSLTYSQSEDVMVICHQSFAPQLLRRVGSTDFTLAPLVFDVSIDGGVVHQPHYKFEAADVTLTASASTGAITLTASAPVFTPACIGQRWRIYEGEVQITAITNGTTAAATVRRPLVGKLDLDPLKTRAGTTKIEVLHLFHGLSTGAQIRLSGCNAVGFIPGAQIDGLHTITVLDENTYEVTLTGVSFAYDHDGDSSTANVTRTAAVTSEDGGGANVRFDIAGAPTRNWTEPAISPIRGYPGGCCFHEKRLWLFGTPSQPDACFGSRSLLPFNFDVGKGYDGDSVQVSSGTEDVSRIWHGVSNGELQIFTALRESIFVTREGEAITPNNARIKGQSSSGCSPVQPVVFDGATLFVQENGLSISEFLYASSEGRFSATPISTLASHLVRKPLSISVSPGTNSRSEQLAFFVNGDGTCTVFHSMRKENIAGFGLWTLGAGAFRSVCSVGPHVFFCVEVRGGFRLYRMSDDDLGCLDGQVKHVSATGPRTAWVLDERVRGRAVGVRTELGFHGMVDVPASGEVVLDVPVETLVAGDPFYFQIELLPPVVTLPNGSRTGMIKRIVRTIVEFDETYSATVGGERLEMRLAGQDFAGPISPVTGPYEVRHLGFGRSPTTVISQTEPLPARVLSALQEVKV